VAARPAGAIVFQNSAAQAAGIGAGQSFLNGEAELLINLSNGGGQVGCSGSLVDGGQYILTAAHCVTGDSNTQPATSITIDFANVGLVLSSSTYIVDPVWNGSLANGGDLALIKLTTPVTSISSYAIDTTTIAVGDLITVAGYGDTGTGSTGYVGGTFGTLYYGQNQYIGVYGNAPTVYAYTFTQGGGAIGSDEVLIAPGDSGGGSFIDINGTYELVGVHDFITCFTNGCTPNSTFNQGAGDTSTFADAQFINSVVPEPASLPLMALALGGIAAFRRRRRSAVQAALA
jgi:hypothetical protein